MQPPRLSLWLAALPLTIALRSPLAAQPAQFRGSAAHLGVYDAPGVAAFGGVQWRVQTDGPVRNAPTLADGMVYVGSADGVLYGIEAPTGRVRWSRNLASSVTSSVAVGGGLVFVGTYDGVYRGLRAADGRLLWAFRTAAPLPLAWGFESGETWTSSPALDRGIVVFGARDGKVYALDAATGRERWRYNAGARVYSSPAVAGGSVFVGSQDGMVHGIDLATGRGKWRFATEGTKLQSENFGFDRTTVQSSPAVSGGTVYVGARDGWHYAIDAATGTERWRVDHKVSWVNTSPAVSDGMVYVGSSDGHFIQAVDAASGAERWRVATTGIVWSSPAVDRARVYIGEGNGTLYALDKSSGKEAWRYRVGGRILSSPVVHDRTVYFGSDDGGIYAVRDGPPLARAVFWDTAFVRVPLTTSRAPLQEYLRNRGYEVLDAVGLGRFLSERVRDRAPSVVVFALSFLPSSVAPTAADTVLFRRYLDAGGKAVWIGGPPLLAAPGIQSLKEIDRSAAERLLGVRFTRGNFDPLGVRATAAGRALGLPEWYLDTWGAEPRDAGTILAVDEQGQAAAWIKSFGGPPGTGFVKFFAGDGTAGRPQLFAALQAIAELRPQ